MNRAVVALALLVAGWLLTGCAAVDPTSGRGAVRFMAGASHPVGDLEDAGYEDPWFTISGSSVLPLRDHVSGGGVIDYGTTRSESMSVPGGQSRARLDMLAISGLMWLHTTEKDVVDSGVPNLRVGAGPRFAWAWEEDSEIKLLSAGEDDWDFGIGVIAEAGAELPLGDRFMVSVAARYTWTTYRKWDADLAALTAVAGIAIRF